MIYLTSDTHFGHKNIIKHCNRPFSSVDEMDEVLINNWNDTVKPGDDVYHLGDVSFMTNRLRIEAILNKLNGNIYLIKGNHDHDTVKCESRFKFIKYYYELRHNKQVIILMHYPLLVWNGSHNGTLHAFGHSHGTLCHPSPAAHDVGVDAVAALKHPALAELAYRPMSIDEFILRRTGALDRAGDRVKFDHH